MVSEIDYLLTAPLTDVQRDLLDAVWYLACLPHHGAQAWPAWEAVQRELYRRHPDLDDASVMFGELPRVPRPTIDGGPYSLLWVDDQILNANATVGLTIAGLRRLGELGANPAYADALSRVLAFLAQIANGSNPPRALPLGDVAGELLRPSRDVPVPLSETMVATALQHEYAVPVTCFESDGRWHCFLELDRQRRYRNVSGAADYFDVLSKLSPMGDRRYETLAGAKMPEQKIFLVHGRNAAARDEVDLFIRDTVTVTPTVLANEANGGLTLIEKFEQHANDACFAVVVMTADDEGGLAGTDSNGRARQNVVFELGYFFGRLGRGRVAVLASPDVEHPSDIAGLVYIRYDQTFAWKEELRRELKNARFTTS